MQPKGAEEEVVRTYLQKLCDGDPQKLAALAGMNQEAVPDDLLEPADMSLANAITEGAEQTGPWTAHGDNPVPVEAAVAPVAVSTPEKVAPEANPAAEEPQTPVNPPKVPRPVAPNRFPATLQHHRPLSSQLCSISTFARESLRHPMTAGKASTQGCEMAKELHTQLGVMTAELCKVCKLQQKQLNLQEQLLELQCKDIELRQGKLQMKEAALKVLF